MSSSPDRRSTVLNLTVAVGALALSAPALFAEPIGLVLSGGGAKGAYEVGVWKAMAEAGLARDVRVISGTSAGALNAALFASAGDCVRVESIWTERFQELAGLFVDNVATNLQDGLNVVADEMRSLQKRVGEGKRKLAAERGVPVEDLLPSEIDGIKREASSQMSSNLAKRSLAGKDRIADQRRERSGAFRRILAESLPATWPADAPQVYVTALTKEGRAVTRFSLNELSHERRVEAIAASSAASALFEPVKIGGVEYVDGGIGDGGDNTPIHPILANHPEIKTIVVVYSDNESRLRRCRVRESAGRAVVEVIPSQDSNGLPGCVNSDPERVRSLIELGYRDATRVFAAMRKRAVPHL